MNCPKCHGKGRTVQKVTHHRGTLPPITLDEIGICPECLGVGIQHCCEGENVDIAFVPDEELIRAINKNDVDE